MTKSDWLQYFPTGRIVAPFIEPEEGEFLVPLNQEEALLLSKDALTPKEQALLLMQAKTPSSVPKASSPWLNYLEGRGPQPQQLTQVQFVHVAVRDKGTSPSRQEEWLQVLSDVLGKSIANFQSFQKHYTLILDQAIDLETRQTLSEILLTLEEDFSLHLSLMLGNVWPQAAPLPALYQAEKALFVAYLHQSKKKSILYFAPSLLWGLNQDKLDLQPLPSVLTQLLNQDPEISAMVQALWDQAGTVTKAANQLYIHRNTLQYRLDRFYESSGLNLRNMDDLALCYLLHLQEAY